MLYSAGYFIYALQLLQVKSHCTIEVHQVEAFRILAFGLAHTCLCAVTITKVFDTSVKRSVEYHLN